MWRQRKKQIDDDDRVIHDRERSRKRTMDRAVRLLAAKPRSVGELRQRLLEKPWTDAEIVDSVIEKLTEYDYLDDDKFAHGLAEAKLRERPQGRRRLEYTMSQRHLDKDTIATALDDVFDTRPERQLAHEAVDRWTRVRGVPTDRKDEKKLFDHLMRRGFSYDDIRHAVTQAAERSADNQG
jgi:regulatory protein